jgi:hypothetical protein
MRQEERNKLAAAVTVDKISLLFEAELTYDTDIGSFVILNKHDIVVGEVTEDEAIKALKLSRTNKYILKKLLRAHVMALLNDESDDECDWGPATVRKSRVLALINEID